MACQQPARGTAAGALPPFNDVTDNNPCGKQHVATANAVDVSANLRCVFHLKMQLGAEAFRPPYTFAA